MGTGALREDVQDQAGAVQYPALQQAFEVAFLGGRQRVIEQDELGVVLLRRLLDLLDLAAADEVARVGGLAGAADDGDDIGAGGGGELL